MTTDTLRPLRRMSRPVGRRGRRGATFVEWVILMPIFMFLILFVVDVGHMVLVNGAMQDATYAAARSGAQVGGGGFEETENRFYCTGTGSTTACKRGVTYERWIEAVDNVPANVKNPSMYLVSGAQCSSGANAYVTVTSTFSAKVLTPGLGSMLRMMGQKKVPGAADASEWTMSVTATSRCEVTR